MQEQLVICDNLIKIYKNADLEVVALQGLDLEIDSGELLAIVGTSGSGKSTLLNILGGLDEPTAGRAEVAGHDLKRLNEKQRTRYRNLIVGYVWQQSGRNLLPDLSVTENVDLPQMFNGARLSHYKRRTAELLELVGLAEMAKKKPSQLSGGEQQRVALAVALANQPALLLADEPTGELDSLTTQEIMSFLREINQRLGVTILIVTHDIAVAAAVDRVIAIRDGRTSTETVRRNIQTTNLSPSGDVSNEAIFIDRVGLLQLPKEAMESLPLRGRVDVRVAGDHVELWPAGTGDAAYADLQVRDVSEVVGLPLQSHREMVLVDRVGRLQLPREAIEHIPFQGRAIVRLTRSHVELWPFSQSIYKTLPMSWINS